MPSDSFIKLTMIQNENEESFKGMLSARSQYVNFEIESNDADILIVLSNLRVLSGNKIKDWHQSRVFAS